jgi:hypothetical protein
MAASSPPVRRVRLRFFGARSRPLDAGEWYRALQPALDRADWEPAERDVPAQVAQINAGEVLYYPYAVDIGRTALLDRICGGFYEWFPWELPISEWAPCCKTCLSWRFDLATTPVPPFWSNGMAAAMLCPRCGAVVVDDYGADKAGATYRLTRAQFRERYGWSLEVPGD